MTLFAHLLRHDLRTHRALLLVWLAVLALHPLSGLLLQWLDPDAPSAYITTAVLVTLARVALIPIIVSVVIQSDGPSVDSAFWRTRPVPARLLAAQKLSLVYATFLLLPAALVMLTAVVAGVSSGDLGWMLGQVLVADALFVGACIVAAAATTRPSTTLLTLLLGAMAVWFGSVGIAEAMRLLGVVGSLSLTGVTAPTLAFTVLSLIAFLLAGVAWRLYVVGPAGRVYVTGAAIVVVVVLAIGARVVLPGRDARPDAGDAAIQLTLDGSRLRADAVERDGVTQVLLSAPPAVSALRSDERAQVWAHDATFRTSDGRTIVARTARSLGAVDFTKTGLDRWPALAVLDPRDAETLRSVPLHYTGSFTVEVLRREPLARATLAPGSRLIGGPYRLRVDDLRDADTSGDLAVADVTVLRTTLWFPNNEWQRFDWHLVDRVSGLGVALSLRSSAAPPSLETLLPTLAPPFMWSMLELRRAQTTTDASTDTSSAELQLTGVGRQRLLRREVSVDGLRIPAFAKGHAGQAQ